MHQVPEVRVQVRLQRLVSRQARENEALRVRMRNRDSTSAVSTALQSAESKLHRRAACASVN